MASYPQYSVGKPNMGAFSPPVAYAINTVAQQLGVSPAEVAAIMGTETAGSFMSDSTGSYKGNTFTGAIHYSAANLAIAAKQMGMTEEALTDSLVAEIMAIPEYATRAGFVPGEDDAKALYAAIITGDKNHSRNTDIYSGIKGKQTLNSIFDTTFDPGRMAQYAKATTLDQGAFVASMIGGGQPSPGSSYFGDLSSGGSRPGDNAGALIAAGEGVPLGFAPATQNTSSQWAAANNTFAPGYAEQSPSAVPNNTFGARSPLASQYASYNALSPFAAENSYSPQAQQNDQFAQAQQNNSFQSMPDLAAPAAMAPPTVLSASADMGAGNSLGEANAAPALAALAAPKATPAATGKMPAPTASQKAAAQKAIAEMDAPKSVKTALTAMVNGDKAATAKAFADVQAEAALSWSGAKAEAALKTALSNPVIGLPIFGNLDNNPALQNAIPSVNGMRVGILDGLDTAKNAFATANAKVNDAISGVGDFFSGLFGGGNKAAAPASFTPSGMMAPPGGVPASAAPSTGFAGNMVGQGAYGGSPSVSAQSFAGNMVGQGAYGAAPGGFSPQAQVASLYGPSAGQNSIPTVSASPSPSASAIGPTAAKSIGPTQAQAIASPFASAIASPFASAIASPQAQAIASPTVVAFAPPTVTANPAYSQAQQAVSAAQQTVANLAKSADANTAPITQSIANTFYSNNGQQAAIAAQQAAAAQNAAAHKALQDAIAALNNTPKTITVPGKKAMTVNTKAAAQTAAPLAFAPLPGYSSLAPNAQGVIGPGSRSYTVNPNGTTTYSTNGGKGSQTFSISGGAGSMPGSVGGAGVGYGMFGIGAPASAGFAYGNPTANVGW